MKLHSACKPLVIISSMILLTACGGGSNKNKENIPETKYAITAISGDGGSISPATISITSGQSTDFTLTVNDGYTLAGATGCNGTLNGTIYSTGNITSACSVTATFEAVVTDDNTAPSAEILYPWAISRTDSDTILVRGVASDPNGVAAVRVNGISAEINSQAPATLNKRLQTKGIKQLSSTSDSMQEVSWQATIEVSAPDLIINVETEDSFGNTDVSGSIKVLSYNTPTHFALDNVNNRLIGSDGHNSLVAVDLTTKEFSKINASNISTDTTIDQNTSFEYVESQNAVIYYKNENNVLSLYSIDLDSQLISTLIHHELNNAPTLSSMDFSQSEDTLYLNLLYFPTDNEVGKSQILKYALATGVMTTILDGTTATGKAVYSRDIAYSTNGLIVFNNFSGSWYDGLFNVALDGSDLVTLTEPDNLNMHKITVDLVTNTAYQTGTEGVIKVDLATGEKANISPEEDDFSFSSYHGSIAIDRTNNKLLVSNGETDAIISVDMENGTRDEYLSNGIGAGKKIAHPRAITLDAENNIIYLADDGVSDNEVILAIDLATANRKFISKIKDEQDNGDVYDMVLDSAAQQLYVLIDKIDAEIIRVDIETQISTVLSGTTAGSGVNFSVLTGMTLDKANNRLLATDWNLQALFAIDLSTGNRTILSSTNVGSGDTLSGLVDVELDAENNQAFVLSREQGAVFSVNLTNGNRELILDTCLNHTQEDQLIPNSFSLNRFNFKADTRQLLIGAKSFIAYDIDDNTCISSKSYSTPLDFILTDANQIITIGNNKLTLQDFESGDSVTISK